MVLGPMIYRHYKFPNLIIGRLKHRSYTTHLERDVSKISTATKKGESCKKRKNKHEKERKMIIE